jgi:glycerol-3-phosphate dehydrogenase
MVARFLSKYDLRLLLIEKEVDICMGTSGANSAFIHAGYDPLPGTMKAKMNVLGNAMWDTISAELNMPFERRGDYVVAMNQDEFNCLEDLMERGRKNGVHGMSIISADEMRRHEPSINPETTGAIWATTAGLVDPFMSTFAAAENALQNGVKLMLATAFEDFIMEEKRIVGVKTNRGDFRCRWVVNAAGLYSDTVMHKAGVRPEFKITPRRGEYALIDKAELEVKTVVFPVPSKLGKGIVIGATLHGNPFIGPNARDMDDKEDLSVTPEGLDEIYQGSRKLIPSINLRHVIATFAGSRAHGNAPCEDHSVNYSGDFVIEIPDKVQGLVNLGGIESPGFTSAPAIAARVVELLADAGEKLTVKKDWNPIRPARPRFRDLSRREQERLVHNNPTYGRVVCRCELVTEGEIIAEIHSPIPALTYDAIKRRTWLGTGRCLGAFDMPRVVDILARETGRSPFEITKRGPGSEFLYRSTKEVEA